VVRTELNSSSHVPRSIDLRTPMDTLIPTQGDRGSTAWYLRIAIYAVLAVALVCVGYSLLTLFVLPQFNREPDAVQALQKGLLVREKARVWILDFNPSQGWPFTEQDYADLPRRELGTPDEMNEVFDAFQLDFRSGRKPHNHPATLSRGIVRIEVSPHEWFYVFFSVMRDSQGDFMELNALPRCSTNPNSGRRYEGKSLGKAFRNPTIEAGQFRSVPWRVRDLITKSEPTPRGTRG
jgi:hypothetical protein